MSRIKAFFFLCRCLSEESGPARGLSLADEIRRGLVCWECVVQIASEYLMTVALYCALMEKGLLGLIPADLLEYFELIHSLNGTRNRGIVEQTVEIAGILNRIGVEPLLFKGAGHIGSGLYGDAAMRIVYDIDILVPEECAVECEECLIAAGYRGAAVAYRPDAHFHGPILRREGRTAGVELHRWSPWPEFLNTAAMYDDSALLALRGVGMRTPSPTAGVIIAIAHAWVQHASKRNGVVPLRDLYDTALVARRKAGEIDWARVVRTFHEAGQMDAPHTHGMMLERLFGQRIPGVDGRPHREWLYWRLGLLGIRSPAVGEMVARNAADLGDLFANSADGRRVRKELATAATYSRKLRNLRTALRRRGPASEGASKN